MEESCQYPVPGSYERNCVLRHVLFYCCHRSANELTDQAAFQASYETNVQETICQTVETDNIQTISEKDEGSNSAAFQETN